MNTVILFVAASALAGGLLGLHFSVFVVIPFSLFVASIAGAITIALHDSVPAAAIVTIATAAAVQINYVVMSAIAASDPGSEPTSRPTSTPTW